jgi:hypothetical protein
MVGIDRKRGLYLFDLDFADYLHEMSCENLNEVWGLLQDYLKEECK